VLTEFAEKQHPKLQFVYFVKSLSLNISATALHEIYLDLLQSTREAWTQYASQHSMDPKDFSYNIGMTKSSIIMCPRISEGVLLRRSDGSEVGFIALNGSLLSGGALVKQEEEWEYFQQTPSALDEVLAGIGVPVKANGSNI
jgi:sulfate adenylyltransferase (ADP) / ATP adenylyltransferase